MSIGYLVNIPGPPGSTGSSGAAGTNGNDAYTVLESECSMPPVGGTVVAHVANTGWMIPTRDIGDPAAVGGQVVIVEFLGSFLVSEIIDATHAMLYNLGYPYSAGEATIAPPGSKVSIGGLRGP